MQSQEGVDLSNNNAAAPADFPALGFCFAKVSEGTSFTDRTYGQWAALSAKHGVLFGGYHFAHPDANDPHAEADYYLARCSNVQLHAVDIESRQGHDPLSIMGAASLANWINQWCGRVKANTGLTPYVYCNRSYLDAIGRYLGDWPIWLAVLDGHAHAPRYANRDVAIEQYAIVGGVDRDVAYIDLAPAPPPPQPAPTRRRHRDMLVFQLESNQAYVIWQGVDRWSPASSPADALKVAASVGQGKIETISDDQYHKLGGH